MVVEPPWSEMGSKSDCPVTSGLVLVVVVLGPVVELFTAVAVKVVVVVGSISGDVVTFCFAVVNTTVVVCSTIGVVLGMFSLVVTVVFSLVIVVTEVFSLVGVATVVFSLTVVIATVLLLTVVVMVSG